MSLFTTSEMRKWQGLFGSYCKEKIKKKGDAVRHNLYASALHHKNLAFLINLSFLVPSDILFKNDYIKKISF